MNLLEFNKMFPTEEACRLHLKLKREEHGITCRKCQCQTKHYWSKNLERWKCAKCKTVTTLTGGTLMEQTHLPLLHWFTVLHFMTSTKKSFSALEIRRQLGYNRYEPIWYMMNKIRVAMGKRDSRYKLSGEVEIDEGMFSIVDLENIKYNNSDERSLLDERKIEKYGKVLVIAESRPNPSNKDKHRPNRALGYMKMIVLDQITIDGVGYEVKKHVQFDSYATTDGAHVYSKTQISGRSSEYTPPHKAHKRLPWVHIGISNAKRLLLGTHHSIGKMYLQNYLNEYCYKLNRRYMRENLFDRLLTAGATDTWY